MIKIITLNLFCALSLLFLLSFKLPSFPTANTPTIQAGTSKITGRITNPNHSNKDDIFVNITVPHPISGEYAKYKTTVDLSGKFEIDVDVETNISWIALSTSLNPEQSLFVKLVNGGISNIDLSYGSDYELKSIDAGPEMSQNDMLKGFDLMIKMIGFRPNRAPQPLYSRPTSYFLDYARDIVSERLELVKKETGISNDLRGILSKDFRLFMYSTHVFDYEGEMMLNYKNTNPDNTQTPEIQKIDRTYFRFLKDFNLNDSQYLHCSTFLEFQKEMLQNETLGLPLIGDTDIPTWLANVKATLSDLVGFDQGQYYDILAANAYARQLNEEVKPLSEKQKRNIALYWKDGEIAKILYRKNTAVVVFARSKSHTIVNDISSVPDERVLETIVGKYKNKVVFVDFWATWCSPCLDAMQQFRSTKDGFRDKDVAFVYLTNGSSPKKLWEEKIQGIGSEHYYLTDRQWEYMMEQFNFEAIPSYLLFDKEGKLSNKFTGFPGSDKVKGMITELL